jgi:3-isopropylmalate dehydratase small subunit
MARSWRSRCSRFRKYCLLNGFDDIGLTLRHADKIKAFEAERLAAKALAEQPHRLTLLSPR